MTTATVPAELGTKKIGALLKEYAIPGIIAMTAVSLYNMVDSIFIGHIRDVGAYAISGLAVTFPFMNLGAALGSLIGIGSSTMISVLLGQKNHDGARRVLGNEVLLGSLTGTLFTLVSLVFLKPILYFFGASPATLPYARDYMQIILIGTLVSNHYFAFNNCIRAAGQPRLAMGLTIFTVVCNTVLDPIFIFTLGLGIRGAAIATVLSQLFALVYSTGYFLRKDNVLRLSREVLRPDRKIARHILSIGMGPFLMNSASCIVALFINQQLRKYGGDLSIGAFGIAHRITFFFVMIIVGFNQGMQPIAGYNFGARQYSRMKEAYKYTALWATLVAGLCFVICTFLPELAATLFTDDAQMKELAGQSLFKMNLAFLIVGFQMVSTTFFQCIGMVRKSVLLSLSRQLIFLVPLLYLMPLWWETDGVWYSFPVSDLLAAVLTAFMIAALHRKLSRLKDGDDPDILGSSI